MRTLLAAIVFLLSLVPCSAQGITPVVTPATATSLVIKATPGRLFKIQAANEGAAAGFLVVLNATSVPSDGAITPRLCYAIAANGNVDAVMVDRSVAFSTGIVAVLTTSASCFTKTTGAATGFISALVE